MGGPRAATYTRPTMDIPSLIPGYQLAIRFGLEVGALLAIGGWARRAAGQGMAGWAAALGLPIVTTLLWVTFAVKGDPSRSGNAPVPVPGWLRLTLELAVFGAGALALAALGRWTWFAVFVGALLLHHAMTTGRLAWLLRQ